MRSHFPLDFQSLPTALAADLNTAFPFLVQHLQDGVFSGALRLTGSRTDAEDLTQEVFVRAYRALGTYPAEKVQSLQLQAWVWTIAANLCRNRARARARHPESALIEPPAQPDGARGPEQQALDSEDSALLAHHLTLLSWPMRAAVVLRHVADLSYPDIAIALGRPEGTVKADVHRGLERLRASLEEHR